MRRKAAGLTLIELMVVLAVAGIVAAVAVPQMSAFVQKQAVRAHITALAADLRQARSEAMRRNMSVVVCARQPGTQTCLTSPDKWQNGWLMYTATSDSRALTDFSTQGVKVQDAVQKDAQSLFTATAVPDPDDGTGTVAFQATGLANASFVFTLVANADIKTKRYLCVKRSGGLYLLEEGKTDCDEGYKE